MKKLLLMLPFLLMLTDCAFRDLVDNGNVKLNKGDYDGAIADYDKTIQLNPNYALA